MDLRGQLQQALGTLYVLERELGGGGMSRVFVAQETALRRRVVVKVLPPELIAGVNVERFKREILVAAQLQHPHIVPIHSAGEMNGVPYFMMPFVEGESLRGRLAHGPLRISEVLTILRDVARALAYAHERGIVHRDIKPDNVLLSAGSATVTDFGIAKAISAARMPVPDGTLTQVGTSIGTPAYMAPEQASGDPGTDHRADLYSFGCLAYELLAGRPPFVEKSPHRLFAAHMSETPQPVSERRAETPPALAELVMRCLAKDADARPQHASDIVAALDNVTSGGGHEAMPAILLGGRAMLGRALAIYAVAFVAVAIVARAAILAIGLPDWVFPGALVVMALGLPIILLTGYAYHVTRRAMTITPTYTPGGTPSLSRGTMATLALKASPHLSWKRASMGGVYAFAAFIGFIVLFMALRAMGIGPAGSLLAAGRLAQREPLLITDFRVSNADSSLGPVVSDAVRAGLAQSSVISLVPAATLAAGLRRMERPPTTRLTLPLALELAKREGVKAVVDGEVTGVTGGYIVTVRLLSADSLLELASFRKTGEGPHGLIDAADQAARALRSKAGESLRSVQATPPLFRVTTGSLDALQKFSEGARANSMEGNPAKAVALLREAVAVDSTFASAWRLLAAAMGNASMSHAAIDSAVERAYALRGRLTDVERLNVEGFYFFRGPHRDRRKAIAVFETAIERGDSGGPAANNLGELLRSRREFARAESLYAAGIRISKASISYTNALEMQIAQGQFDQAARTLADARQKFGPNRTVLLRQFMLQYNRGHFDAAQAAVDTIRAARDPSISSLAPLLSASLALVHGRLGESRRAILAFQRERGRGVNANPLRDSLDRLMVDAWYEPPRANVRRLDRIVAMFPLRQIAPADRPYFRVASIYALSGRPDRARQIMAQYRAEVRDTALLRLQAADSYESQGEIALAEHRPLEALAAFRAADREYDGLPASECGACVAFDLARAFDAAQRPDSAILMYERYLALPFYVRHQPAMDGVGRARTHRRLGELYEANGDAQNALSHYSAFLSLWKDADPELQPQVGEIRKRIQRLSRMRG